MVQQLPTEHAEQEINLLELLLMLVKRKLLILCITLVAAVASVCISLLLPNIYTAKAKVLPPQKEGGGLGLSAALGQLGGLAAAAGIGSGFGGSADLYISILKSRSVADAVIAKLDLKNKLRAKTADDARLKFAAIVNVQAGVKDGIITISAENENPEFASKIVNTIVEELGRRTVQLNFAKVSNERLFFEKRLEVVKKDLRKAEDDLKSFSQKNKAIKIDDQAKASIEGVAKLKGEIAKNDVQLAAIRTYQTDESPEVQALVAVDERLKKELNALGGSGGGVGEGIPSVGNIPSLALEYIRRMREVKIQEAILEQLTKQYELDKINENRDTSTLQILDDAVVPDQKSKPRRSVIVVLSTMSAFFISLFLAFSLEHLEKLGESDKLILRNIKRQLLTFPSFK
jgi:uncharacterized protein involved in exopolysaccharide biosynthesis